MKKHSTEGQASRLSQASNPPHERQTLFQVGRFSPLRAALPIPRRARSDAPYLLCLALLLAVTVSPSRAQIVGDGASRTLINVTTNFTGDVTVGTNGSFTLLVLSDNALLTNSANGVISLNPTATSNEVRLVSASWLMGGRLFVGSNGAFSTLVVSNGAFVRANAGTIGNRVASGSNVVLVTGSGSTWSSVGNFVGADLLVGGGGSGNQLIVSNGGLVVGTRDGIVGNNAGASNNVARVNGSGSVWSNALDLRVGFNGTANRLVIEAGGLAHSDSGWVGNFGSASNNEALVTGPGSLWTNRSFLTIGSQAGRNRLVVSNGAAVKSGTGVVGSSSAASNNQVVVTGAGSVWNNQTDLVLGGGSVGNRVDVNNGGAIVTGNGIISSSFTGNSNTVVLTDSGSVWNSQNSLIVGQAGNGNVLIASNGAMVLSSNATLGVNGSTANNNLAAITGAGTLWSNRSDLVVGSFGVGNRLVVSNGATVLSGNLFVGFNSLSANNRVTVDGGTLRVTNASATGVLDVRRGTNVLNAGLVEVDQLLLTNAASFFEFNGGTLLSRGGIISNGANFVVGDSGTVPAVWDILGGSPLIAASLPSFFQIHNGVYRPTDYEANDTMSAPAPSGPYEGNFSTLIGTSPNGNWSLFIMDDFVSDTGSLASWSLQLQTTTGASTIVASSSILIPTNGLTSGRASPYPSVLTVAGLSGTITNLTVTLSGLSHTFPGDLDVLLLGPGGQKVMLMSDAGHGFDLVNATLVFVDHVFAETTVSTPLLIGRNVSGCQLLISSSEAALLAGAGVIVGANSASTGNRVLISGGTLRATNASATATFDVRRGTNVLNSGLMDLDNLLLASSEGYFEFNGGTLISRATTDSNGRVCTVGNGVSPATLQLPGGTHVFFNNLDIANNASLVGHGSILGTLTVKPGGTLAPSNTPSTFGTLSLSQTPVLQGATRMRIYRSEASLVNDQVQTTLTLNYGGSLTVTQFGGNAVGLGDRFQLFSASAYAGAFSTLTLPPLNSGLAWTNKLAVDGSIEVVAGQPEFASISLSGTNVILNGTNGIFGQNYAVLTATNVMTPLSNWVSLLTSAFGLGGGFSFTNGIAPGELQRYFRIRVP